jgi:prepilin signal peptidase PulO-like enzyme (type II secretory pathway)
MSRYLLNIARWIVGIVFIFSGFVKGIDPWGFEYKLLDYFHSLGFEWLTWLATPASFILPLAEFLIGIGLLFGVAINISSFLGLLFMSFFTPLTFYIAIKNPVTDCGCFGDALVITNWQTFYKNIFLIILATVVFVYRKKITGLLPFSARQVLAGLITFGYIFTVYWSFNHEPIFDFRPYKVGVNIPEAMKIPEGAPTDVYKNSFSYRNLKTNELKRFNDDNIPWQDSLNWKFESMGESVLVSKGYTPPIHDFYIQTTDGTDVADFFFEDDKFTFILVAYNLDKSSEKRQQDINYLAYWAKDAGYNFICLTSTTGQSLENFKKKYNPSYDFLFGDEITLKTIIRSNPGLLLTRKGTILAKWHYNDIPTVQEMKEKIIPEMTK